MSDCSSKAFEVPKTCGNCDDFSITGWCHEYEMGRSDTASICKHYKENQRPHVNTLEQRYQKLEQVAKELYQAIAPMHEPCCEDICCNLGDSGWNADCCFHDFEARLKELGVNIDD